MRPFTVRKSIGSFQLDAPNSARIEPFTVWASAMPLVETSTEPFTVCAYVGPVSPSAVTEPFTVRAVNPTPAGTRTTKCTWTSLLCVSMWPSLPGSQVFLPHHDG